MSLLSVGIVNGFITHGLRVKFSKMVGDTISKTQKFGTYMVNAVDGSYAMIKTASIFMVMFNITNELKSYAQHCGVTSLPPILNTTLEQVEDPRCEISSSFFFGMMSLYMTIFLIPATMTIIAKLHQRVKEIKSSDADDPKQAVKLLEFEHE